jgi:serine-type D-Ala-D-Ala carboxypeptidase/endopeptidase
MRMKQITAVIIALIMALVSPAALIDGNKLSYAAAMSDPLNTGNITVFLDSFFTSEPAMKEVSAAIVSVVKDGAVVVEKGYGVTDLSSGGTVDPANTTFRVGSISKVFTVLGVMQLVDQGKIKLDDNIEKYLDGYQVTNPFGKPVTVEMLLTHSTGLEARNPMEVNFLFDPAQKPDTLKEAIFSNFPPVVREPGTSYMYDNFASGLAGYIVQEVSGEPFGAYMSKNVFEPLGMMSSTFDPTDEPAARLPAAYELDGKRMPNYRLSPEVMPEGSMITTASDMSKFMISFMTGGKTPDGRALLMPSSLQAMSKYHLFMNADVPDMTYGFEAPVPLAAANGIYVIAKAGSIPGFQSYLFMLPEEKTAVFVSAVAGSDITLRLFKEFMDRFYPGDAKFGDPSFKLLAQQQLKKFEGIYRDLQFSRILTRITASGDGRLTSRNTAGQQMTLKQTGELLFVDERGNPMVFQENTQGRILYVKYSNPLSYASKFPAGSGYVDVPQDHPYAEYIYSLQSMGIYLGGAEQRFNPDGKVTREAFIHGIMSQFNLPMSSNAPLFQDIAGSPYKAEIQGAVELELVTGTRSDAFEPSRFITREEAAVIIMRLLQLSGYPVKVSGTNLVPGTSPWAEQAVKTLIDLQMHGVEVSVKEGRYDYGSRRDLTNQEFAAIQYLLMLPEIPLIP